MNTYTRNLISKIVFLAFFATSNFLLSAQEKNGCLSVDELITLYHENDSLMNEILTPANWVQVSKEENSPVIIDKDTLWYHETTWQFTMSFDFYLLKIYEIPNYNHILELETEEQCFGTIYDELKRKYAAKKITEGEQLTHFQPSSDLYIQLREKDSVMLTNYKIRLYNPIHIQEQLRVAGELKLKKIEILRQNKEKVMLCLSHSDSLMTMGKFEEAMSPLDSANGLLPEFDSLIFEKKVFIANAIKERDIAQLIQEGTKLFEEHQLAASKSSYEKVLQLDSSNKYSQEQLEIINRMLLVLATRKTTIYNYAEFYPESADSLSRLLESAIGTYTELLSWGRITGSLLIKVDTVGENISSYTLQVFDCEAEMKQKSVSEFSSLLDSMIISPLIQSVKKENILVNAATEVIFDVNWAVDEIGVRVYKGKIKIEKEDREWCKKLDSLLTVYDKPSGNYYFKLKEKNMFDRKYVDISLDRFKVVGPEAALYSMLFPGAGTMAATQGRKGIGAMSAFVVFGAGTLVSYLYSKKMAAKAETFSPESPEYKKYKMNSLYLMTGSYIGLGISGVIYISDVFNALAKGINNLKQSKELRRKLKDGPLFFQQEPVKLP